MYKNKNMLNLNVMAATCQVNFMEKIKLKGYTYLLNITSKRKILTTVQPRVKPGGSGGSWGVCDPPHPSL